MSTVLVLGHRGMLGHVVAEYFRRAGLEVVLAEARFDIAAPESLWEELAAHEPDVVVNCVGAIKQKESDPKTLYATNSLFPWLLRLKLHERALLLQPSTDCIYSGSRGGYSIEDAADAKDDYGLSKAIGEQVGLKTSTRVIRCSIIGPEVSEKGHGLMGWFLGQREGGTVRGFSDHLWNGITTLEWAKIALEETQAWIADPSPRLLPPHQPGTAEIHTKAEMLQMIAEVWKKRVEIQAEPSGTRIDRSLKPTQIRKPLRQQLHELRSWYLSQP